MTLPHSLDYLMTGGVLDFDAAAYLNSNAGGVNYNPQLLGGATLNAQPKKDSFSSKAKAKLTDTNFLKKAATVAIVGTLAFFGIKKGKNLINSLKGKNLTETAENLAKTAQDTNVAEKAGNMFTRLKDGVMGMFKKVSK